MARKKTKYQSHKQKALSKNVNAEKDISRVSNFPFSRKHWMFSLIFILVSFLLYGISINFGYVLDDQIVITGNSYTQKGFAGIWDILTTESFQGYFGEQVDLVQGARYRPLSIVTFAVEYGLWGQNAALSHTINILLYGFVGVLLFRFLHLLYPFSNRKWWWSIAFIASLLYIIHPLHIEAVANIKGRDEILTFLLALAAAILILKWEEKSTISYGIWGGLVFFLSLLAKENAITFLAVIPAIMYFFKNKSIKQAFGFTLPLLIAATSYLWLRYTVIGYLLNSESQITDLMNNPFLEMNTSQKYATISFTLWKYLQLSFFPHPLSHDYYPYAIPILNWDDFRAFGSAILYVLLGGLGVFLLIKRKKPGFAIWFYLVTLSIVSNIFVNVGTFMNERFLFISSAATCMIIAMIISKLGQMKQPYKYLAPIFLGLYIIGFTYKTYDRIPDWASALALNKSAVAVNPGSLRANSFMSTALYNEWRDKPFSEDKKTAMEEAYRYADRATEKKPDYKNAQIMKAGTATELFKIDKNVDLLLQRFTEIAENRPDIDFVLEYTNYLENRTESEKLINWYYDVGYNRLYRQKRNGNYSLQYLKHAYRLAPRNKKVVQGMAEIYQASGNQQEAEKYFKLLTNL